MQAKQELSFSPLLDTEGKETQRIRALLEERRRTLRMLFYWDYIRAGRVLPHEEDIHRHHEIVADVWDHSFIVHVREFAKDPFNYTYIGPALVKACEGMLGCEEKGGVVALDARALMPIYTRLIQARQPLIKDGEMRNRLGVRVQYRQCFLPFGKEEVETIIGHVSYQLLS